MIDWDTLRIVLSVHRMGGLSGASRELKISQPTVSRHLAKAEADLNCKLFDRRQGRLVATEAGLIVIREAEQVDLQLQRMQDSVRSIDNEMSGPIRLNCPQSLLPYCLTQEILDFQALYPDVSFELSVTDTVTDMTSGQFDVVIRAEQNPKPSLWGYRIALLGNSYCAHQSLIETYSQPGIPLTQVKDLPLISHQGITSSSLDEVQELFPLGRVVFSTDNLEAVSVLVSRGAGVSRVPHLLLPELKDVHVIAQSQATQNRGLWILTHKDLRGVRRIERFIEFVREKMKGREHIFQQSDT